MPLFSMGGLISGDCFKITYFMTNQSLFSNFKSDISLIKIIVNTALNLCLIYVTTFNVNINVLPRIKLNWAIWAFLTFLFSVFPSSRSASHMTPASCNCCLTYKSTISHLSHKQGISSFSHIKKIKRHRKSQPKRQFSIHDECM